MRSRSGAELPQLELECLAALWQRQVATVADVHAEVGARGRPLAYTTILTVMERLWRKQAVERRRQGRAYLYSACLTQADMRERALKRLIDNYFVSRQELRQYLDGAAASPDNATAAAPREIFENEAVLD